MPTQISIEITISRHGAGYDWSFSGPPSAVRPDGTIDLRDIPGEVLFIMNIVEPPDAAFAPDHGKAFRGLRPHPSDPESTDKAKAVADTGWQFRHHRFDAPRRAVEIHYNNRAAGPDGRPMRHSFYNLQAI